MLTAKDLVAVRQCGIMFPKSKERERASNKYGKISQLYDRMVQDKDNEGVGVGGWFSCKEADLYGLLVAGDGFICPKHVFVGVPHITAIIR